MPESRSGLALSDQNYGAAQQQLACLAVRAFAGNEPRHLVGPCRFHGDLHSRRGRGARAPALAVPRINSRASGGRVSGHNGLRAPQPCCAPFGYYGSIIGGLLALALVAILRGPAIELLGALALAAPWTQAIGRFRCIVQGCCHGRPVDWGIRVTNPHSRVVKLAELAGRPIHPTPLYSILANMVIGVLAVAIVLGRFKSLYDRRALSRSIGTGAVC